MKSLIKIIKLRAKRAEVINLVVGVPLVNHFSRFI